MVWFTIATLVKPLNPWSKSGLNHQKRAETPKNIPKYGITINLVDIRLRKNSFNLHNPLLIRIRDALESLRRMSYLINGFWFTINITKNKKLNINDDTVLLNLWRTLEHFWKIWTFWGSLSKFHRCSWMNLKKLTVWEQKDQISQQKMKISQHQMISQHPWNWKIKRSGNCYEISNIKVLNYAKPVMFSQTHR